jgi:hypothetical protein
MGLTEQKFCQKVFSVDFVVACRLRHKSSVFRVRHFAVIPSFPTEKFSFYLFLNSTVLNQSPKNFANLPKHWRKVNLTICYTNIECKFGRVYMVRLYGTSCEHYECIKATGRLTSKTINSNCFTISAFCKQAIWYIFYSYDNYLREKKNNCHALQRFKNTPTSIKLDRTGMWLRRLFTYSVNLLCYRVLLAK